MMLGDSPAATASALPHLLSKQTTHTSQHTVLLRVVWVVFAGNLENGRKRRSVGVDAMTYAVGNLLVWG